METIPDLPSLVAKFVKWFPWNCLRGYYTRTEVSELFNGKVEEVNKLYRR